MKERVFITHNELFNFYYYKNSNEVSSLIISIRSSATDSSLFLEDITKFCKALNIQGLLTPLNKEINNEDNTIYFENPKGINLAELMNITPNNEELCIKITIGILKILDKIHKAGFIHDFLTPEMIFYDEVTNTTELFFPGPIKSHFSKDNLKYIAPEKTGRLNYEIDYRSDYFSLGLILLELLNGKGFQIFKDPLDMVYKLMDGTLKETLHKFRRDKNTPLCCIISKLLMIDPLLRYQSSLSLECDLKQCLVEFNDPYHRNNHNLKYCDVSTKFQITDNLIARHNDIKKIVNVYKNVKKGKHEAVFISGCSGIGKSSVLEEIIPKIAKEGSVCISGKYDQYNNEPYSAIKGAITKLVNQLFARDEDQISLLKDKLLKILGANGGIFLEIFPQFKQITGDILLDKNISPQDSKKILNRIIIDVIQLFTLNEAPLVLILDDLQWIDTASSKLLYNLFYVDSVKHFLFIGTYRDNEIINNHIFRRAFIGIKRSRYTLSEIKLKPLDVESIKLLLNSSFKLDHCHELSRIILKKTEGIPFYINYFLRSMYTDGFFTNKKGVWYWDKNRTLNSNITDNVVEIVLESIDKLDANYKFIMSVAAFLGNSFDLKELISIIGKEPYTALVCIQRGISDEYIIREKGSNSSGIYRFTHDRIQQAFYDTYPRKVNNALHLKIARKIYGNVDRESINERIFDLVHHYNKSKSLIDIKERVLVSKLNLIAGENALSTGAWESAFFYLEKGINLLPFDNWKYYYDLSLKLFTKGAEIASLCGKYKMTEEWIKIVEKHSHSILDNVAVWKVMLQSLVARKKLSHSFLLSLKYLRKLGIKIPEKYNRIYQHYLSSKVRSKIKKIGIDNLLKIKKMNDPVINASLDILTFAASSAYISFPYMFQLLSVLMIELILKNGICIQAAFSFLCYALVLNNENNIEMSYRLGSIAKNLADSYGEDFIKSRIYVFYAGFIDHWKNPLKRSVQLSIEASKLGMEKADFEYVAHSLSVSLNYLFNTGENLNFCIYRADYVVNEMIKLKQNRGLSAALRHRQIIKVFLGQTESFKSYSDSNYNEYEELKIAEENYDYNHIGVYHIYKMMISYYYSDYENALKSANEISEKALLSLCGQISLVVYYYFYTLTLLALYPGRGIKRVSFLRCINQNIKKIKLWAKNAPENHKYKILFIYAELERIKGDYFQAIKNYNSAIVSAKNNNFINDAALINEKAALFFRSQDLIPQYKEYMKEAYKLYYRWGSEAKLDYLKNNYTDILFIVNETNFSISNYLDYTSILEATQTISREVIQSKLLRKVITTILKTTGAERVLFFLHEKDEIILKAIGDIRNNYFNPEDQSINYATSIVNYVKRTGQAIIVNGNSDYLFQYDKYILDNSPKSILCQPILWENHEIGIIYLENSVLDALFNDSIKNIVNILSTQTAISIENSNLYKELENQYIKQYELEEKNKEQLLELVHAEKLASVGFLIAEFTHEINNPNQAIMLNATHLKDFSSDILTIIDEVYRSERDLWIGGIKYDEFKKLFTRIILSIEKSSVQINTLINELKKFIHNEPGDTKSNIDFNDVISSTLIISSYFINRATSNFKYIPGNIPKVQGNFQSFQQVLLNILRNACQSLTTRDSGIWILTNYDSKSKYITIDIEDQGCGISEENLSKISIPFYTTKGKSGGTGLGLYISRSIIQKAGGTLEIYSTLGIGTTVTIKLPVVEDESKS